MNQQNKGVVVFAKLGLTIRQAQVYLANAQIGRTTAKEIAKNLQIDRAEVYRAMVELEKFGLIYRSLTKPTTYTAVKITDALSIIVRRAAEESKHTQREAKGFIKTFKTQECEKSSQNGLLHAIIQCTAYDTHEFEENLKSSQISVDFITTWHLLKRHLPSCKEIFLEAIEKGIKIRYLTYIPKDEELPSICQTLSKHGSFEIKHISTPPALSCLCIIDGKKASFTTFYAKEEKQFNILHIDDPGLVATVQDYFDIKWTMSSNYQTAKKQENFQ
jgi:sugar-specific transcriptional regulator TrmB